MKTLGIVLLAIGVLWGVVAFNTDTTVSTEGQFIGSTYIPSQKVNNIGKMDERRNHLMATSNNSIFRHFGVTTISSGLT